MDMEQDPRQLIARLAVAVMIADGRITASELDAIDHFDELGFGPFTRFTEEEIDRAMHEAPDLAATCGRLAAMGPEAAATIVAALAEVAASDGTLSPRELDVLAATAELLGLKPADTAYIVNSATAMCVPPNLEAVSPTAGTGRTVRIPIREVDGMSRAVKAPPTPAIAQACRVLGLDREVNRATLNAAYLATIERFNPMKVAALGSEFSVLAVRRLAEATAAFETVLKSLEGRG